MTNFTYYNPVEIRFGIGASRHIGETAAAYGKRVLLVSYADISYMQSTVDAVLRSLIDSGMDVTTFFAITANPLLSQVQEGIRLCRKQAIEVIVGLGGGSVMDAAKTIGVGSLYDGDVWDMFCHACNTPVEPMCSLPTIMIPTLPATSSEMNNIAVVTNEATTEKAHICARVLYPKVSLVDPALTCSLPAYQTACGGVDAISHIMESYFNCAPDTPLQDRLQEAAMSTLLELLPQVLAQPHNAELRASIQWASTLAWNGWLQAGVEPRSPMHPIGHVLSARFQVTHGATLGIVMPAFFRYVCSRRLSRFAQLGRRVFDLTGSDATVAAEAIDRFEAFIESVGVPTRLSQVGIGADSLELLANDVVRVHCGADGALPSDPPVYRNDILAILQLAL